MEKTVEYQTGRLVFRGIPIGGLYLSQDLRFTHDQRIKTGRNPEDMADGILSMVAIQVRFNTVEGERMKIGQKTLDLGNSGGDVAGDGIHFNPVAGGHDEPFRNIGE